MACMDAIPKSAHLLNTEKKNLERRVKRKKDIKRETVRKGRKKKESFASKVNE